MKVALMASALLFAGACHDKKDEAKTPVSGQDAPPERRLYFKMSVSCSGKSSDAEFKKIKYAEFFYRTLLSDSAEYEAPGYRTKIDDLFSEEGIYSLLYAPSFCEKNDSSLQLNFMDEDSNVLNSTTLNLDCSSITSFMESSKARYLDYHFKVVCSPNSSSITAEQVSLKATPSP